MHALPFCGVLAQHRGSSGVLLLLRVQFHHEGSTITASSTLDSLPKAPPPSTITWGLGLQHMNSGETQHLDHSKDAQTQLVISTLSLFAGPSLPLPAPPISSTSGNSVTTRLGPSHTPTSLCTCHPLVSAQPSLGP